MNLRDIINDSDMILVGIGESFQEDFSSIAIDDKNISVVDEFKRNRYIAALDMDETIEAYNMLAKLLEGKNYFVVTLCDDDKIYKSNLREDRIVAPCGTYAKLQCDSINKDCRKGYGKKHGLFHCGIVVINEVNRILINIGKKLCRYWR